MTTICEIQLRKILDSRGNPTVEADIYTENGFGRAAAPTVVGSAAGSAGRNAAAATTAADGP